MHKLRSGLNANTKKKLMLGEGAIFKNYHVDEDNYESARAAGKLIGACQGGSTFEATATVRNIEVDGIPGAVTDLEEIDRWDASLQTTFLEVSAETIKAALGAVETSHENGYTHITGRADFISSDYVENITFVGSISGTDAPIILQIKNAIGNGQLSINVKNGDEAKVPVTFNGRYTIETLSAPPFDIWYPDIMQADTYKATVAEDDTVSITVTGFKTSLTATSSNAEIASATTSNGTITITGEGAGDAVITVTDADNNKIEIAVHVTTT